MKGGVFGKVNTLMEVRNVNEEFQENSGKMKEALEKWVNNQILTFSPPAPGAIQIWCSRNKLCGVTEYLQQDL